MIYVILYNQSYKFTTTLFSRGRFQINSSETVQEIGNKIYKFSSYTIKYMVFCSSVGISPCRVILVVDADSFEVQVHQKTDNSTISTPCIVGTESGM